MHAQVRRCRCRPRGCSRDWRADAPCPGDAAFSAIRSSGVRHTGFRAQNSLALRLRAGLAAPALLAMGFAADLGRSMGGPAAEFLGKPGAAPGAGRCLGAQMASALDPPSDTAPHLSASSAIILGKRMRSILKAAAIAAALAGGASACALAMTVAAPLGGAPSAANSNPLQKAAVVCGPLGCGHIWRGRRHGERGWGRPWGYAYPPACPIGYYYACRRGPAGYRQCACWPYRTW